MKRAVLTEQELWEWMMEGNYPPGYPDANRPELVALERRAYAILSQDVRYVKEFPRKVITRRMAREGITTRKIWKTIPKGTRIKVVMASRMGDVGITPKLDAHHGYVIRIPCIEGEFTLGKTSIPIEPAGLLTQIEPLEDPRSDKVTLAFPGKV